MVNNMEDHTAIQKGRAPTVPERKAHTAIRPGELPRVLKERAPYKNYPYKREISFCHQNGRAHTAIRMGEPTPGVVAPTNQKRESSHCIQMKKEPSGAR